jgi:hypothetical protein
LREARRSSWHWDRDGDGVWNLAGMSRQTRRTAASAASASAVTVAKNAFDWPRNRPVEVRNLTAATAPPFAGSIGRMIEQSGSLGVDELARLREDVVRPSGIEAARVEIREERSRLGVRDPGQRWLHHIAGDVLPDPEMIDLGSADADHDPQHLEAGHL